MRQASFFAACALMAASPANRRVGELVHSGRGVAASNKARGRNSGVCLDATRQVLRVSHIRRRLGGLWELGRWPSSGEFLLDSSDTCRNMLRIVISLRIMAVDEAFAAVREGVRPMSAYGD